MKKLTRSQLYYLKNRDRILQKAKEKQIAHSNSIKDQKKRYYQKNSEIIKQKAREYRKKNRRVSEDYREKNKELLSIKNKEYRSRNKKELNRYRKEYVNKNRGLINYISGYRRAKIKKATPAWLLDNEKEEIKNLYILASELSWLSECGLHVDHIIPINGKNVSGLHVPWNLQILPASINRSKGNRL